MKTIVCIATLLFALPVLAAEPKAEKLPSPPKVDARPDAPPSPLPVTWEVWGYKWDNGQWVKQPDHCFKTTDLKKAADYAAQITGFAGWSATTNMPESCIVHTVFHGPAFTNARPSEFPDKPTYSVWAFKLANGKWVKDEKYSWTTPAPLLGLQYTKNVNAVPGWTATNNCPAPVPDAQRYVDGGTVLRKRNLPRRRRVNGETGHGFNGELC